MEGGSTPVEVAEARVGVGERERRSALETEPEATGVHCFDPGATWC